MLNSVGLFSILWEAAVVVFVVFFFFFSEFSNAYYKARHESCRFVGHSQWESKWMNKHFTVCWFLVVFQPLLCSWYLDIKLWRPCWCDTIPQHTHTQKSSQTVSVRISGVLSLHSEGRLPVDRLWTKIRADTWAEQTAWWQVNLSEKERIFDMKARAKLFKCLSLLSRKMRLRLSDEGKYPWYSAKRLNKSSVCRPETFQAYLKKKKKKTFLKWIKCVWAVCLSWFTYRDNTVCKE